KMAPGRVAAARGRGAGKFGGSDFVWQPEGTLRCPAGATLVRVETSRKRGCSMYAAPAKVCAACGLRSQCVGGGSQVRTGRSVTVFPPPPQPPPPKHSDAPPEQTPPSAPLIRTCGPHPVFWQDVAAVSLRRALRSTLSGQRVEVERTEGVAEPTPW